MGQTDSAVDGVEQKTEDVKDLSWAFDEQGCSVFLVNIRKGGFEALLDIFLCPCLHQTYHQLGHMVVGVSCLSKKTMKFSCREPLLCR